MWHSTNRGMRRVLMVSVVGALLAFASGVRASIVPLSLEEMVAISDNIVEVQVTETQAHPYQRMIVTTAKFQVVDRLKGDMKGEQSITYLGGQVGPLVMDASNVPQLYPNERAILFLSRPVDRLPKSLKSRYNQSSPLVSSFKVVGGSQGKIDIIDAVEGSPSKVARGAHGSLSRLDSTRAATTDVFKGAVRDLVNQQEVKAKNKAAYKSIRGVYGSFAVPDRSTNPAVRAFDPLPSIAYMSTEDINKKVETSYSKPENDTAPTANVLKDEHVVSGHDDHGDHTAGQQDHVDHVHDTHAAHQAAAHEHAAEVHDAHAAEHDAHSADHKQ